MSEIAVRQETLGELRAVLSDGSIAEIEALLPEDVSASKFLQIANAAARTNPDLAKADKVSLFSAIVKCATAGLMPDGEEAALAAFGGKVTFMPMIAGYRKVAGEYGWDLRGYVVHETDDFEYQLGDAPWVRHAQTVKLGQDRGPMIGAYAVATHRDGTKRFEVMDARQILAIKAKGNKALWNGSSEYRMWEKTPCKALFKRLPLGEKESVRIRAMLDELGVDPESLMYGTRQLPPPTEVAEPTAEHQTVGNQQADPDRDTPPTAGSAPGFNYDKASPVLATGKDGDAMEAGGDPDTGSGAAVADHVAPEGLFFEEFGGQPIAAIAQDDRGREKLVALLSECPPGDPFRDAVEAYARAEDTGLWSAYEMAKRAA